MVNVIYFVKGRKITMNNLKQTDIEKNGKMILDLVKEVIDETGPRLPCSEEEKRGAAKFAEQVTRETGLETKTEGFKCAPVASIGFIPVLGYLGYAGTVLFYLSPIASFIISICLLLYAVLQIFTYTGVLDILFKKKPSQNVYATLEPKSGVVDRTILLSGHLDSSWCWQLSAINPNTMMMKTIIGVISIAGVALVSLIAMCKGATSFMFWTTDIVDVQAKTITNVGHLIMYILPIFAVPGCYWLSQYLTWDKKVASPGAMDNLTGCELGLSVVKYYKEHMDELPENTRLMCAGLGCEEAGLKGSEAFTKAHKADFNEHYYSINLDSFRDYDHFNAIKGDTWLFTKFDKDLTTIAIDTMKEIGVPNPGAIENPVGGCDSTPFKRAGVKTITIAAQDPRPTNYYHTYNDTVEGLNIPTLEKSFELVVKMVPKVVEYDKNPKEQV